MGFAMYHTLHACEALHMLHFQAGVEANPKEYIGCPISLFLHCHL